MNPSHVVARSRRNAVPALLACLLVALPAAAQHAHGDSARPAAPTAAVSLALDPASLARVPREPIEASAHGKALHCEGRRLDALLRRAGAMPEGRLPGPLLARYVRIDARDGYRAVYSLAELDPGTGNRPVYLVDRCNDEPLDEQDGPLRLIAPQDVRPARWVRQVEAITVEDAK